MIELVLTKFRLERLGFVVRSGRASQGHMHE